MKAHGKIPTDFNTGRVLQCLYLWAQENKKQHTKIPNCSLMKAGLFSFSNKKHLCGFPSHPEKQIYFFPFHAQIWFKFWPNFGEGPPKICLVVEREEAQRFSWREAEILSKFIFKMILKFSCGSLWIFQWEDWNSWLFYNVFVGSLPIIQHGFKIKFRLLLWAEAFQNCNLCLVTLKFVLS